MGDIRMPTNWRKPRSRIYDYNRDFGGTYYQPMLNYLDSKERQGVFFEKPVERIHFPDSAELRKKDRDEVTNFPDIDTFLVKAYAQQAKEMNSATVKVRTNLIKGWTSMKSCPHIKEDNAQTHYDNMRLAKGEAPGRSQCNYYINQLSSMKVGRDYRRRCKENHMKNVYAGDFTWDSFDFGDGGAPADGKFFDPKRIESIVGSIKFVNPERSIPVI